MHPAFVPLKAASPKLVSPTPNVPTPDLLIFSLSPPQVQHAFLSSVKAGYQLHVRSGGHTYEGLASYSTSAPFVLIDLANMHSVSIDLASKTAWIKLGATLGEIYYGISQVTSEYEFPARVGPTVGSGGHLSGGGYGLLSRKYGTSSNNVLDVHHVDAQGRLLDRASMGEDVFWALRGGGGGTWEIIVARKLQLVSVTPRVIAFCLPKTGKGAISELLYRWQALAPKAPPELFSAVYVAGFTTGNVTDVQASFYGQYLGTTVETLALMGKIYPELGLSAMDCKEGKWIEAVAS
ncbi:hypothetical protein L7F22_023351 [Adiantum nelumboides]|nr:hypothetical protein [Adiantum nelumboides]